MSDENIDNIFETVCINIKQLSGVDINRPKYHRIFLKLAKTVYNNSDIKRTEFLNDKCIKKTTEFFSDYLRKKGLDNPGVEQFTNPPASGVNSLLNTSNNMCANPMDGYCPPNQDHVLTGERSSGAPQVELKRFINNKSLFVTGDLKYDGVAAGTSNKVTLDLNGGFTLENGIWDVLLESVMITCNSMAGATDWAASSGNLGSTSYFAFKIDEIQMESYSSLSGMDNMLIIPNERYGNSVGEGAAAHTINYKLKTNFIARIKSRAFNELNISVYRVDSIGSSPSTSSFQTIIPAQASDDIYFAFQFVFKKVD